MTPDNAAWRWQKQSFDVRDGVVEKPKARGRQVSPSTYHARLDSEALEVHTCAVVTIS